MVSLETIEEARAELEIFVEDNFALLGEIIKKAPTSYDIKSMNCPQDEAWRIGFGRCLAELQRLAIKAKYEDK